MRTRKTTGFVQAILIGAAIGLAGIFALSLVVGALILSGTLPESVTDGSGIAVSVVGALFAAYAACAMGQERKLFLALGASVILLILLAVLHVVLFQDAAYRFLGSGIGVICAGVAVGLLRSMKRERRKYRR